MWVPIPEVGAWEGTVWERQARKVNGCTRWEWPKETHHLYGKEKLRLRPGRGRKTRASPSRTSSSTEVGMV